MHGGLEIVWHIQTSSELLQSIWALPALAWTRNVCSVSRATFTQRREVHLLHTEQTIYYFCIIICRDYSLIIRPNVILHFCFHYSGSILYLVWHFCACWVVGTKNKGNAADYLFVFCLFCCAQNTRIGFLSLRNWRWVKRQNVSMR